MDPFSLLFIGFIDGLKFLFVLIFNLFGFNWALFQGPIGEFFYTLGFITGLVIVVGAFLEAIFDPLDWY